MNSLLIQNPRFPHYLSCWTQLEVSQLWPQVDKGGAVAPDLHWTSPSEKFALDRGQIHLWRAWLDRPEPCRAYCRSLLSMDECSRAVRYHFEIDRHRYIIRRGLLRIILGRYLQIEPAQLQFTNDAFGKPLLTFPSNHDIKFNLSHSEGLALYAVTPEAQVGVDIERVRVIAEADRIASCYFSPCDAADWRSLPVNERPLAFLRYWTHQEACLKAMGCGISGIPALNFAQQAISKLAKGLIHPDNCETATNCLVRDLLPAPGYVASIAFQRETMP